VPLDPGVHLGPYEIVAPLGAGGMGEVYRARDARLDRIVALKILPTILASDPAHSDRFEREARAVAAISHPNIVAIHDVGRDAGVSYAVMELLEGQSLRERLVAAAPRGLPVRTAIDLGLQVARGLAAAHEKGIVHRDLKPENIFVTVDGRAKILDFGLAKQPVDTPQPATITPTLAHATTPGTMLGTVGYMAPEQARGLSVDQRADIFSFGAVLYEALSGRRAFPGDTAADTISAILHHDPEELPHIDAALSPALDRVVRRCLEKNAAERFHSAHDLAYALEAVASERRSSSSSAAAQTEVAPIGLPRAVRRLPLVAAAALVVAGAAIGAGLVFSMRREPRVDRQLQLAIVPPEQTDVIDMVAVSSDGQSIAFVGTDSSGVAHLWIRRLAEGSARMLPGTEDAAAPFWAPDGRSLGFFANGQLQRIELAGGPPRTLAPVSDPRGGTWNDKGLIVFAPSAGAGLYQVSADGGNATPLTTLDAATHEVSHRFPTFLPDGRHVLFVNRSPNPDERLAINVVAIDAPQAKPFRKIVAAHSTGHYSNGRLFWVRGTTLFAQPFDLSRLELTGEMSAIAEHVVVDQGIDGLVAMAAAGGTTAARISEHQQAELAWFGRDGRRLDAPGIPGGADPEMSSDGHSLAFDMPESTTSGAKTGMWTVDVDRATTARVGPALQNDIIPTWSPDGSRIIFASDRAGSFDLYDKRLGPEPERLLLQSALWKYPEGFSPDGRLLLFSQLDPKTRADIWVLPMDGGKPMVFVQTPADEGQARFSPDGRWVAYASNEKGRAEVYVRAYPPSDARWQVSVEGGANPLWRRDGGELFFLSPDNKMMSATVRTRPGQFEAATPTALFQGPRIPRRVVVSGDRYYAVGARGDRFLIRHLASDIRTSVITIVLNR
jgi:Tol biopolymer transport system component